MKEHVKKFDEFVNEQQGRNFNIDTQILRIELPDGIYYFTPPDHTGEIKLYDDPSLEDFSGKTIMLKGNVTKQETTEDQAYVNEDDETDYGPLGKFDNIENDSLTDEQFEAVLFYDGKPTRRFVVPVYYDVHVPMTEDEAYDKKLAMEVASYDRGSMKNRETTVGEPDFVKSYH